MVLNLAIFIFEADGLLGRRQARGGPRAGGAERAAKAPGGASGAGAGEREIVGAGTAGAGVKETSGG